MGLCCVLSHLSCVQLFATPWTVACQAPLSMRFFRQEYWNGLPFPTPGDLPNPGIESTSLMSPALACRFFYFFGNSHSVWRASLVAEMVKNLPAMQETQEICVWSLGWEDPLEEENGNPFQYSCLKNPMARGAWCSVVQRVTKSWKQLNTVWCEWCCCLIEPKDQMVV